MIGLWIPKLRAWLIPIGLLFHGMLYVMLPVSTFTVTMWVLYLAFLPPDAVHEAIERMLGRARPVTA